jgi:sugar/nucleoside kinase (ribokinase family)
MSVTLAHEGVLVSGPDGTAWEVPALTRDVVDRMGAGDAYLAVSSPCAAARLPLEVVALLGSAAGALAVRIVGNRSAVEPAAVERLVAELLP